MKKIFIAASALIIFYLGVIMLGHAAQLAAVADAMLPGAGLYVFWILITVLFGSPLILLAMFFSLPKPMVPPDEMTGPRHDAYFKQLAARLKVNPLLKGERIETQADVEAAIAKLSKVANQAVRDTASAVFVSTAVLQNGRLDGLIVLATQLRLVWRIARIYYQRPSPRQLIHLYGNVSANVLIADSVQEIDFAEISAPIVSAVFPSLKGAIPGLQGLSSLLVNSLANGSANAFLTLRIGMIARMYCEATATPNKAMVRKNATIEALVLVKEVTREQGAEVARRAWGTVKGLVETTAGTTVQAVKTSAQKISETTTNSARAAKDSAVGSWESISDSVSKKLRKKPADDADNVRIEKSK